MHKESNMDTSLLSDLGLSPGEIKVYLALLEHGSLKTGDLSKFAHVHTSKVYLILDRLIEKGLCSYIFIGKTKHFQAADPEQIFEYIKLKKQKLASQEKALKNFIPKIKEKQEFKGVKQTAVVFEGYKGIKTLLQELLIGFDSTQKYLVFSPGEEFQDGELNKIFKKHHLNRIEKKISVNVLALNSQKEFYEECYRNVDGYKFRYSSLSLPAGIDIVGNKISFIIGGAHPAGYLINSEQLAKRFKEFFAKLWVLAEE
jgi:sugar-specific transcriptional regulator TrmB